MNKAKNGKKENKKEKNTSIKKKSNNKKEIKLKESSIQTDEEENIYKKPKKRYLKKPKKDKFDSKMLSKYIPIIFLMCISFYLYKKSLKGCEFKEESKCLEAKNIKKFYKYGYKLLLCSFIVGYLLLLMLFNLIPIFIEIPFLCVYIYFFYSYQGADLKKHGIYNSILLTIVSFIIFLLYLYLYKLFKNLYKLKFKKFFILFLSIVVPLLIIYYLFVKVECNNFYKGLNNLEISQNKEENKCYFPKPKFCTIKIFDNMFDLSKIMYVIKKGIPPVPYISNYFYDSENYCLNRDNSKSIFFEFANRKKKFEYFGLDFAYPDTSIFDFKYQSVVGQFHYKVFNKIYDYNKSATKYKNSLNREKRANPEIVIHFKNDTDNGELTMDLRKDEKLIYKRRKLASQSKVRYDNILFIFIDAVSKNHFRRKFPLTSELLSNYLITDKDNNENNNINAYQFLKYNNFRPSTQVNVLPMFYGESMKSEKGSSLIKYFKDKGYITGGSENICHKELFLLEEDRNEYVKFESFDHENFAMFCDPNYNPPNNRVSLFKGLFSMMRRCLYNKDTFEWVFEFGYKFLEQYKNERKFLRLGFIDGHEGTMEAIKYLDKHLFKFLQFYINNYFTNSTAIFIVSDHGENMFSIHHLINSDEFLYERTLGTLFLLLPSNYQKPKDIIFEENLEIIDFEDNKDKEEEDEYDYEEDYDYDDEEYIWGEKNFNLNLKNFAKRIKDNNIDKDYFNQNKNDEYLNKDLYDNNNNINIKKEYNKKENNYKDINNSNQETKVYIDFEEYLKKYYLNKNFNNKDIIINDENSYEEKIIIIDENAFFCPYNKTAIFINQQRFVTPYDIHDTMVYLVSNDNSWKSKKGQTLTEEIDGLKRSCELYIDDFDNQTINEYCHCIPFQ